MRSGLFGAPEVGPALLRGFVGFEQRRRVIAELKAPRRRRAGPGPSAGPITEEAEGLAVVVAAALGVGQRALRQSLEPLPPLHEVSLSNRWVCKE